MSAQYTVGEELPNGAQVVSDTYIVLPDGSSTEETMVDSANNKTVIFVAGAGTPAANQQTIQANILTRQAQIQAWIAANPSGAVLTAAQTLTLAQMLNGLCKLLLSQFTTTTGT